MSVRDLFEKKYADAIENLNDDILEIFDYILDLCEEVEYTRDIQRKRICELERENNLLKNFFFEAESLEENSDELSDILSDAEALLERLKLISEISALAESVQVRCKTLSASTDKLRTQREECGLSIGTDCVGRGEYEEDTYFTDNSGGSTTVRLDDGKEEAPVAVDVPMDDPPEETVEEIPSHEEKIPAEKPSVYPPYTEAVKSAKAPEKKEQSLSCSQKKTKKGGVADDDISDITSRLKTMLDEGDVKETENSSDSDGYSELLKRFLADGE